MTGLFGDDPVMEEASSKEEFTTDIESSAVFSDAPEQFGHPRESFTCIGHKDIEARIKELHNKNRLPHALIFSGSKGIGKATLAYKTARFLLAKNKGEDANSYTLDVPFDDQGVKLVTSGAHPDMMSIELEYDSTKNKYKKNVAAADVRKTPLFLSKTSAFGGWRVVIIDEADTMSRAAQNAVLKILEEPPSQTLLILITHRPDSLLPTIRSRARVLQLSPLSEDNMRKVLDLYDEHMDEDDIEALIQIAAGSPGIAIQYAEEGGLENLRRLGDVLSQSPHWNWPEIHKFSEEIGKKGQENSYNNFTETLLFLYKSSIMGLSGGQASDLTKIQGFSALSKVIQGYGLKSALDIYDQLLKHFEKTAYSNLDRKQSVLRAFAIMSA